MQSAITLTNSAIRRITEVLQKENEGSFLRIRVDSGGCSGFQYAFNVEHEKFADDITIQENQAVVVVDKVSLDLIQGAILDFVQDLSGSKFVLLNPNATTSCGCGNSFSV